MVIEKIDIVVMGLRNNAQQFISLFLWFLLLKLETVGTRKRESCCSWIKRVTTLTSGLGVFLL
jgi:hypothetical protein